VARQQADTQSLLAGSRFIAFSVFMAVDPFLVVSRCEYALVNHFESVESR